LRIRFFDLRDFLERFLPPVTDAAATTSCPAFNAVDFSAMSSPFLNSVFAFSREGVEEDQLNQLGVEEDQFIQLDVLDLFSGIVVIPAFEGEFSVGEEADEKGQKPPRFDTVLRLFFAECDFLLLDGICIFYILSW
jgi:hypothetical protein